MKIIGKPYSGKLNVRFDEGELEIGQIRCHYANSLLYWRRQIRWEGGFSLEHRTVLPEVEFLPSFLGIQDFRRRSIIRG
jgi:hypothetical protein